jgi:hypothetical protein
VREKISRETDVTIGTIMTPTRMPAMKAELE